MLFIIELLFLFAGLWTVLAARPPQGLFRVLFGKGEYQLQPNFARLYGLVLASPLPVGLLVSFVLALSFGTDTAGTMLAFEVTYLLVVAVASIVVARRVRQPAEEQVPTTAPDSGSEGPDRSYGVRLLIMVALAVVSCITLWTIATFALTLGSIVAFGARNTGNFSEDVLPFLVMLLVIPVGLYGSYRLIRLLRT